MTDPITRGLGAHVSAHRGRIAAGEQRLGWKVAFNAPNIQSMLGLSGSLLAGLCRSTVLDSPVYALGGSKRIAIEAEVRVTLDRDVDPHGTAEAAARAVAAWGPAFEVVEFDRPLDDVEAILTEGVFHRAVLFGPTAPTVGAPRLDGVVVVATADGEPICEVDAEVATGTVGDVLLHASRVIEPHGERLLAGDTVILGAMNPLTMVKPYQIYSLSLGSFESLGLTFEA